MERCGGCLCRLLLAHSWIVSTNVLYISATLLALRSCFSSSLIFSCMCGTRGSFRTRVPVLFMTRLKRGVTDVPFLRGVERVPEPATKPYFDAFCHSIRVVLNNLLLGGSLHQFDSNTRQIKWAYRTWRFVGATPSTESSSWVYPRIHSCISVFSSISLVIDNTGLGFKWLIYKSSAHI